MIEMHPRGVKENPLQSVDLQSPRDEPENAAMNNTPPHLILASTSAYRRALLERLALPFTAEAPGVDEQRRAAEAPGDLAIRLAVEKARAVADRRAGAVVIGSDQVATTPDGGILGKPGTVERAVEQLLAASGRAVRFLTAVAVVSADGRVETHTDCTTAVFRHLTEAEVRRYVELDRPLDCAGSFRSEALGAALLDRVENVDPTALVGLPLVWLAGALRRAGLDPLSARS
jgi:septum formation protein